jgi:hypothetical protein
MSSSRRRLLITGGVAFAVALATAIAIGVAEDDSAESPELEVVAPPGHQVQRGSKLRRPPETAEPDHARQPPAEPEQRREEHLKEGPSGAPPRTASEHAVAATFTRFVDALNAKDGAAVCSLFAAGALDDVDFPVKRGSCAETVAASIGYRDPHGYPVWKSSTVTKDVSADVRKDSARVTATVFTRYAEGREPTVEDDVIYLAPAKARWQIVKPSATFYRAIGAPTVPLDALTPP